MSIILRKDKGSELTFQEVDDNFQSLYYSSSLEGNNLNFYFTGSAISHSIDLTSIGGAQGVQGTQGAQGYRGLQGVQGPQGVIGAQGIQGIEGAQGIQGTQGIQGRQGRQGIQGSQGIQGVQGITGQGIQGIQGLQGTQGVQGTSIQGLQGITGAQGIQGIQGTMGAQGLQGRQGVQGTQGFPSTCFEYIFEVSPDASNPGEFYLDDWTANSTYLRINGVSADNGATNNLNSFWNNIGVGSIIKFNTSEGTHEYEVTAPPTSGSYFSLYINHIGGALTDPLSPDTYTICVIPTGPRGIQGRQGIQGISGGGGSQGVQGAQGIQGTDGAYAAQGIQGTQGTQGIQGSSANIGSYFVKLLFHNAGLTSNPFSAASSSNGENLLTTSGWTFTRNATDKFTITHPLGCFFDSVTRIAENTTGNYITTDYYRADTTYGLLQTTSSIVFQELSAVRTGINSQPSGSGSGPNGEWVMYITWKKTSPIIPTNVIIP